MDKHNDSKVDATPVTDDQKMSDKTPWQFKAGGADDSQQTRYRDASRRVISVKWSASEFISHKKSFSWFLYLGFGAVVIAAVVYVLTRDKITTAVIIFAALMLGIFAVRQPRTLEYEIDESGIRIGARYYSFEQFKSFSVANEGAFSSIVFMPLKRFMPALTVYFVPADEQKIMTILMDRLPFEQHRRDPIDNLMRRIRF